MSAQGSGGSGNNSDRSSGDEAPPGGVLSLRRRTESPLSFLPQDQAHPTGHSGPLNDDFPDNAARSIGQRPVEAQEPVGPSQTSDHGSDTSSAGPGSRESRYGSSQASQTPNSGSSSSEQGLYDPPREHQRARSSASHSLESNHTASSSESHSSSYHTARSRQSSGSHNGDPDRRCG